jgi:hypothetical protein
VLTIQRPLADMPNRHVYSLKLLTPVKVQIYSIGLERAKSAYNFTKNNLIFGCRNPACRQICGKPWHKYFGKTNSTKHRKPCGRRKITNSKRAFHSRISARLLPL